MPSLTFLSPGAPALPPGLAPVMANPIASIGGAGDAGFAGMIAAFGQDTPALKAVFSAPLPPAQQAEPGLPVLTPPGVEPSAGTSLPPDRPEIAGSPAPLPPVPVEDVMIGSRPVPPASAEAATPTEPVAAPVPDSEPVACGLQIERFGTALGRIKAKPLPAPLPLPPAAVSDDPEPVASVDAKPAKEAPADPEKPGIVAAPPIPQMTPPPPSPAVVSALPPAMVPRDETVADTGDSPLSSQVAASPVANQLAPQAQPLQSLSPQPASALPHSFTLSPEVARDIAQFVRAATGDTDERAPEQAPAFDPASLPPLPQAAAQPTASLHPSFVPSHRPAIDTGRAEWMQNMIERIAEMPGVDNKREAQLRLVPDALGPVDVKIEQRDQRLHVTLNAQTPEARQLLSDAAPRLQELAEARGIRFSQTGFGGADAHDRRPQPDHQPASPLRPRSAQADAQAEQDETGDLIA